MKCLLKETLRHIKNTAQEAQKAVQETDKTVSKDSMEYFLSRVPAMRISAQNMINRGE